MSFLNKLTEILTTPIFTTPVEDPVPEETSLLEHVVAMTDPRLASVPHYEETLGPAIDHAIIYLEQAIAAIPGPIAIDSEQHPAGTLLGAVFPNQEDITAGLGRSLEIKQNLQSLADQGHQTLYALLGLRTRLLPGGQEPVLTDHTFRSLAATEEEARLALRDAAFNSLLQAFASQTGHYLKKLELMKDQKELINEAAASPKRIPVSGVGQSIDAHITRAHRDLLPEKVMLNLRDWLLTPENHLRLEAATGHTLHADQGAPTSLHLPLMSSQDRRQWLVCFTRFNLAEAMDAIARETHTHRFILI